MGDSPGIHHRHRRRGSRWPWSAPDRPGWPRRGRCACAACPTCRIRTARRRRWHLGHRQPRHADVRVGALHLLARTSRASSTTRCRSPTPTIRLAPRSSNTPTPSPMPSGCGRGSGSTPRCSVAGRRTTAAGPWKPRVGSVRASALVCCTGITWDPRMPDVPGHFDGQVIHSVDYRDPSRVRRPAGADRRPGQLGRRHRLRRGCFRRRRVHQHPAWLPLHPQVPGRNAVGSDRMAADLG